MTLDFLLCPMAPGSFTLPLSYVGLAVYFPFDDLSHLEALVLARPDRFAARLRCHRVHMPHHPGFYDYDLDIPEPFYLGLHCCIFAHGWTSFLWRLWLENERHMFCSGGGLFYLRLAVRTGHIAGCFCSLSLRDRPHFLRHGRLVWSPLLLLLSFRYPNRTNRPHARTAR